ncbi:MAG: TonB-dependent siderophore receptor [Burkholderiaceae bacterium]|jgi:iron complex outermembrane receptor protein|nr:TonB-dependent siderophore receptor [Burkholderiaceae bacterium]
MHLIFLSRPPVPGMALSCLCLALATATVPARAQSADAAASTPASKTAAPAQELETIQIRADRQQDSEDRFVARGATGVLRSDAPLFETAQSISVVTHQQIEEKQLRTVAEALEGVAGVSSGAYGRRGWDDFIIRGQISSAQTYVDGLRAQTSTNVLRSEDIFGIASIDVVKGPTSVGFGLALPGGLVNLTTKRPQAESFARAGVSYGSYGLKEANFDLNYAPGASSKGALRIVGRASDQQDPTDYVYFKNQYLATSYNFDLDGRNELSVIASYQHRDYIRNQGIPQNYEKYGRKIFIGEPDRSYKVDSYRLGANYAHYFDNDWVFRQNFALSKGSSLSDSVFAAANARFPLVARQINYQDKQDTNIALDSYLQRHFQLGRVGYELTAGVDMMRERSDYYQRVDNINAFNADRPVYGVTSIKEGKPSWNLTYNQYVGLYLRNTFKIDEKWIVGLSGRHDWTRVEIQDKLGGGSISNSNTAFTGSASLMYQVNDFLAPYVSHSTSFMPVTDAGINGSLLNPEEGRQTELGVKFQALDRRVQGYVAVYDLRRRNVTEYDATLGYSIQTGEQTTKGFEAEIAASLTRQWNVSAAYSYIPTARTSQSLTASEIGKRTNHVPRNAGTLFTQYYFSPDRLGWNMGAGLRMQGARTAQRGSYFVNLPKYTLFDLNLGYEQKAWGVNLAIKNLLDKDYIQGTTPNAQLISFGSPRTVVLSAKFRY